MITNYFQELLQANVKALQKINNETAAAVADNFNRAFQTNLRLITESQKNGLESVQGMQAIRDWDDLKVASETVRNTHLSIVDQYQQEFATVTSSGIKNMLELQKRYRATMRGQLEKTVQSVPPAATANSGVNPQVVQQFLNPYLDTVDQLQDQFNESVSHLLEALLQNQQENINEFNRLAKKAVSATNETKSTKNSSKTRRTN